ncbi:YsnF/AvaK domain-containing protein [Bacillus lacus]|uniref:YsnF/AvaK domain-containing protein n=1 Tax=Metabacillus lacus TaxID=1983721 RepID=A0A7X2LZQ0_9BACI|nr:YsnF/AvaK domain-containing protein [Metabacillus lacus]MRX71944.1 YsnF/AvaK domain-containing protein [Metabacillus lacus]
MSKHVVGIYSTEEEVIRCVEDLTAQGYSKNDISVVTNGRNNLANSTGTDIEDVSTNDRHNDSFLDKMKSALLDDGTDNSNVDVRGRLTNMGISNDHADRYADDINNGKFLVLTSTNGTGTTDMNSRSDMTSTSSTMMDNSYGTESTMGTENTRSANSVTNGSSFGQTNDSTLSADEERKIQLREEELNVQKERVQAGEVHVNKEVVTEQKSINVPVEHEEVYVERRSVDGREARDASPITDGEEIRVPVIEEKIEVTKKPVVTDELVIGKKTVQETKEVRDTVRREEASIDSEGSLNVHDADSANGLSNSAGRNSSAMLEDEDSVTRRQSTGLENDEYVQDGGTDGNLLDDDNRSNGLFENDRDRDNNGLFGSDDRKI